MEATVNMQELHTAQQSQQSPNPPTNASESSWKNRLQQYAQRAGLDLPVYETKNVGQLHAPQFKCLVTVGEETYESLSSFPQKKASEQDAAKHALKCIFEKRQEKGISILSKNNTQCKAILNEFAAKVQVDRPKYRTDETTQKLPMPIFLSTVEFRGESYTGKPARTKKEAEQLLAHDVIISILGNQEEDSTLLEILISKAKLISAMESSMDSICAPKLDEGSNSASGDIRTSPTQQDPPAHDVLMLADKEEQIKEGCESLSLPIESCKVTSPPTGDESLSKPPSSSQNPINHPSQVLAKEACNPTQPLAHQNPTTTSIQLLTNEADKYTQPQALEPVSLVPSPYPNPISHLLQALANEGFISFVPQAHGPVSFTPPTSTTQIPNFASSGQAHTLPLPVLPQNLMPPTAPAEAVVQINDIAASCASQLAESRSRNQRRRARKKARTAATTQ